VIVFGIELGRFDRAAGRCGSQLSADPLGGGTMLRGTSIAGLFVLALTASGCQYPLLLVISNATDAPISVTLRLFAPESKDCEAPRRLSFIPISEVGRRFGEPARTPASDSRFDTFLCSVEALVPSHVALELEFDPLTGYRFAERGEGAELTVKGEAGSVVLQGGQVRRAFEERSGSFVLEYRAA
jgi:hypothetical protein